MSDVKRYLPGSNQCNNQSNSKHQDKKTERRELTKETSEEMQEAMKNRTEQNTEVGREIVGAGKLRTRKGFTGDVMLNRHHATVAIFLAFFMIFSAAVPPAQAMTGDWNNLYYPDDSLSQSAHVTNENMSENDPQFFRSTSVLTRILSVSNTGWYISMFSDAGFLQDLWETLQMMINGNDESLNDEMVQTTQETSGRTRRSSDSNQRKDVDPSPDHGNPGDPEEEDPGAHDPTDPGENVEDPGLIEPGNGDGDGGTEGGNDNGDTGEPNTGDDSGDGDGTDEETVIKDITLELTIEGQGTVTSSVYNEGQTVTGSIIEGINHIKAGSNVTLTAVPADEYVFLNWSPSHDSDITLSTDAEYKIDNIQENLDVSAHFKPVPIPEKYAVNITFSKGGSAALHTDHSSHTFEKDELVMLVAEPEDLFSFSHWSPVDDPETKLCTNSVYSFNMPEQDVSVKAHFDMIHPFEGGTGDADDPYQIKTADQLTQLAGNNPQLELGYAALGLEINLIQAYYKLVDDIVLSTDTSGGGWTPIGGSGANPAGSAAFTGSFDGNNKTIKNLTINRTTESHQAMFHTIGSSAIVKNLTLEDFSITAKSHAAALAVNNIGTVYGVIMRDSSVTAASRAAVLTVNNHGTIDTVTVNDGIVRADSYAAGIAVYNHGMIKRGRVESSTKTGLPLRDKEKDVPNKANPMIIVGTDSDHDVYGAGLVASNGLSGSIKKSSVEATILVKGKGQKRFAGLLTSENRGIIDKSYTIGIIDREAIGGTNELIYQGGLVGINRNTKEDEDSFVINSYTIVYQASSGTNRGGAIGFQTNDVNPDKSTAIQFVYAVPYFQRLSDDQIGGIIGGSVNRTLLSTYYDKTFFTKTVSGKGFGRITDEMIKKDTYENWDFESIWAIDKDINNGYPYLKWQDDND